MAKDALVRKINELAMLATYQCRIRAIQINVPEHMNLCHLKVEMPTPSSPRAQRPLNFNTCPHLPVGALWNHQADYFLSPTISGDLQR